MAEFAPPLDELVRWNDTGKALLLACLQVAVPLRIAELAAMTPYERGITINVWTADAVDPLGSHAAAILAKTRDYPDEPGTARMFGHIARAIAALACAPGGISAYGVLWCARHHRHGIAAEHCPDCQARPGDEIPDVTPIRHSPPGRPVVDVNLPEGP